MLILGGQHVSFDTTIKGQITKHVNTVSSSLFADCCVIDVTDNLNTVLTWSQFYRYPYHLTSMSRWAAVKLAYCWGIWYILVGNVECCNISKICNTNTNVQLVETCWKKLKNTKLNSGQSEPRTLHRNWRWTWGGHKRSDCLPYSGVPGIHIGWGSSISVGHIVGRREEISQC